MFYTEKNGIVKTIFIRKMYFCGYFLGLFSYDRIGFDISIKLSITFLTVLVI